MNTMTTMPATTPDMPTKPLPPLAGEPLKTKQQPVTNPAKPRRRESPELTFAPLAWMKLQFFCHIGGSEIGGFAITAKDNPLHVERFETVLQGATPATVEFSDDAVADFFDRCVDEGLTPQRFGRIWCHTHPGESPEPSGTDERTFERVFGTCDWAVMFILSRTSQTYARLSFGAGPGGSILLPVRVDWEQWPTDVAVEPQRLVSQMSQWRQEYAANVHVMSSLGVGALLGARWGDGLEQMADNLTEQEALEEYFEVLAELRGEVMP